MKQIYTLLFLLTLTINVTSAQDLQEYELKVIKFEGNREFSSGELKTVVLSKESPFWGWKFLNSVYSKWGNSAIYFDSSFVRTDLYALQSFYHANGFFESKFTCRVASDTGKKQLTLIYAVEEGNPFTYADIKIRGLKNMPELLSKQVYQKLDVDSTDRFRQEKIEGSVSAILFFLYNNGYMNAGYDSTLIFIDTLKNKANLHLFFSPGQRFKIGEIVVSKKGDGEQYVSEKLIKEIIAISPEEYYDLEKIKASQSRLVKTGLFTSAKLEGGISDPTLTHVPVQFDGVIGSIHELSPEIVMDNDLNSFNLGLGGNFVKKNFLGDARKLTLNGKFGLTDVLHLNPANIFRAPSKRDSTYQGYIEFSAKSEQPFVFNRPIYGSLEFYIKTRSQLRTNTNIIGSRIGFEFEMPDYTFINQLRTYYNIELYDLLADRYNNVDLNLQFNSVTSLIGLEFGSAKTNNMFFPTNGINLSFITEAGISNSRNQVTGSERNQYAQFLQIPVTLLNSGEQAIFYRLQISYASFYPIAADKSSVLGIKFKTGYIHTFKGSQEFIPPNKTFIAGGSNSLRGWRARQLVPEDSVSYYGLKIPDDVRGGNVLVEGSFEYRKRFMENYGVAVFTDYGNTWNGYNRIQMDKFAVAVGFGIRYYSSIAPFRLDFGYKLFDPSNQKWIFKIPPFKKMEIHFGIGEAF